MHLSHITTQATISPATVWQFVCISSVLLCVLLYIHVHMYKYIYNFIYHVGEAKQLRSRCKIGLSCKFHSTRLVVTGILYMHLSHTTTCSVSKQLSLTTLTHSYNSLAICILIAYLPYCCVYCCTYKYYLYDRCVGVQRHCHGVHIPCTTRLRSSTVKSYNGELALGSLVSIIILK